MREPDNPMVDPCYKDWPTVEATDPYDFKRMPCSGCGELTADFDLDEDQICPTCYEEIDLEQRRNRLFDWAVEMSKGLNK